MALDIGALLSGGAKGFLAGSGLRARQDTLKLQQQKQAQTEQQKRLEQGQKLVDDALKIADEGMKSALTNAAGIDDPVLKNVTIDNAKKAVSLVEQSVFKTNLAIKGDPNILQSRFKNIRDQPQVETSQKVEAQGKGLIAGAQEQAKQEVKQDFPSDKPGPIVVLEKGGDRVSLRQNDPKVDELLGQGFQKATTPSVSSEVILPILLKIQKGEDISPDERKALDEAKSIGLIEQIIRSAVGGNPLTTQGSSFTEEETLLQQARDALANGKDETQVKQLLRARNVDPSRL